MITISGNLYTIKPDGSALRQLTTGGRAPDSERIAFQRVDVNNYKNGGIAVMRATPGAAVKILRKNPHNSDAYSELWIQPDWSPRGDKIAIGHESNYDHTFVDAHVISEPPEPTWTSRSRAGRPSSIPTGTWVAGYDWDYDARHDVIQDEHQDRPGR
ncbi:MAG: hypothetical protein V9G19_06965 [Tetrasphaera sp.]